MTLVKNKMTADDLLPLTDDRHKYELVRGELKTMAPTGGQHGDEILEGGDVLPGFSCKVSEFFD